MRVHEFPIRSAFDRSSLIAISHQSAQFESEVIIKFTNRLVEHTVDVKSLLGMLLLPIAAGTKIRLQTRGRDEEEALNYIFDLFDK